MSEQKSTYCTCLYHSANALSRLMTRISDEEFAGTGLSSSYAFLLMSVHKKPGIQPKELSEQLQLTPSTVTRLIEKLEYRGLLERRSCGRSTEVFLSQAGEDLQPKLKTAWQSLYRRYSGILGEEQARSLTANIYNASLKLE